MNSIETQNISHYYYITCSSSAVFTVRPVRSSILWLTLAMTGSSSPSSHALKNTIVHQHKRMSTQ